MVGKYSSCLCSVDGHREAVGKEHWATWERKPLRYFELWSQTHRYGGTFGTLVLDFGKRQVSKLGGTKFREINWVWVHVCIGPLSGFSMLKIRALKLGWEASVQLAHPWSHLCDLQLSKSNQGQKWIWLRQGSWCRQWGEKGCWKALRWKQSNSPLLTSIPLSQLLAVDGTEQQGKWGTMTWWKHLSEWEFKALKHGLSRTNTD